MRVSIVGGGPGGLYLALLLRGADPAHCVTVHERNLDGVSYGWGVVLSVGALGAMRDADGPSHEAITDEFAHWDRVDVLLRDQVLRCGGHAFGAIARLRLLEILRQRCRELGVRMRPGSTVGTEHISRLADECDLLVGADGVHSAVRDDLRESFSPTITAQGGTYAWYGTDLVLEAFTFAFQETEHGLFQAHAYPFDEHTSTFIVECAESTWRAAGLDRMTAPQQLAYCQEVFGSVLGRHRLLDRHSTWQRFERVHNLHWRAGRTVLLGDAAHTAHFSIGSGTKLAVEDAIALADALDRQPDVPSALVDYERARQPVVERFQRVADTSASYFERVGGLTGLAPAQFGFHLLTRSGRIGHAALTVRDPDFTRKVDAWCGGIAPAAGGSAPPPVGPAPAFTPLRLGGLVLDNRIVRTSDRGGMASAARSGAGLVLGPFLAVSPDARITEATPTLCHDADIARWLAATEAVHAAGSRCALRLGHAGPRGATVEPDLGMDIPLSPPHRWPLVAASPVPYGPRHPEPREITVAEMEQVRAEFADAAARAAECGADILELDMAHGYLLAGFLSPLSNRRTDDYGGEFAQRLRFPLEVAAAVRATWPEPRPLAVRLTAEDGAPGGLRPEDGVRAATALAATGVDLVRVETGQTRPNAHPGYRRRFLDELGDLVRNGSGVATLVGGYLTTVDEANTLVGAGRADLCLLAT